MLLKKFKTATQSAPTRFASFFFALWGYIIVRPKEKGESDSNPSIQPANRPEEQSRGQNKCALARARPQWLLLCFTLPNRTISARSPVQGRLVSQ